MFITDTYKNGLVVWLLLELYLLLMIKNTPIPMRKIKEIPGPYITAISILSDIISLLENAMTLDGPNGKRKTHLNTDDKHTCYVLK